MAKNGLDWFGQSRPWQLGDPISCGLWTNLLVRSPNGQNLVRNAWRRQCFDVGNTAQQCRLGLFQDSDCPRDLWRLKINIRRCLVHFQTSHVCANKLDVQETDFSFTQFHRSWNHFSRCRFKHGRYSRSHSLRFGDWSISFRTEQNRWTQARATEKTIGSCQAKHA